MEGVRRERGPGPGPRPPRLTGCAGRAGGGGTSRAWFPGPDGWINGGGVLGEP